MKNTCRKALMAAAVVTLFGSTDTFADGGDIAAGVKAGTPGGGVELIVGVSSTLNVRSGFNYFSYEGNKTEGDINYDYDMALSTIPILLDWHPFTRTEFRLTGGVFINNNKADGKSTPQNALKIGGKTYTSAQVGTLTGTADFNSISPYFGIGWGNAVGKDTKLSLAVDLGIMFQDSPDISLSAHGPITDPTDPLYDPTFPDRLAQEEKNLENDIDEFKYYPVITVGLTYKI